LIINEIFFSLKMLQVDNKNTINCVIDTTCPQQCPTGTGRITTSSRGPHNLGDIIGLSPDATAELERISKLYLTDIPKALPKFITTMSENSSTCDDFERVRNAISEQLHNQSNNNTQITAPMVVINPPLVNDLGTRGREYKSGDTEFSFVQDGSAQYMTTESILMRDAVTQSPVDMLAIDGSILLSGIILFCDGCHHFFKEGDTWHGCKHITVCDDCHAIICKK
jgi:hypothetical protein